MVLNAEDVRLQHCHDWLDEWIERAAARIDWSKDASEIHNLVRGFNPWPTAWTHLGPDRLKVHRTRVVDGEGIPGTIIGVGSRVLVAAGTGAVELEQVQLPGKRAQSGSDLVNSGRLAEGMVLGEES